jgi:cytoskeletal protein CcmA (bactofilin family)/anti-sigma factor RsiW/branched-subunit amino acid transport protein
MSCFPELTYAIYVDGELAAEERRPVEAHLIGCLRCRELVVALREEAELLGNTLLERTPQALPAHPASAPAPVRGLAVGLGPVLVGVLAVTSVAGWILESAWPTLREWIGPITFRGAYDMAFDLAYVLREEAPAAVEVGLAVAAMATVSALLCFVLTALLRRWSRPSMLALATLLAIAAPAPDGRAHFGIHEHEDYTLPAGETHDGTLFASGKTVNVDGVVEGDLVVFTRRLAVRGEIRGNVLAIARDFQMPGAVTGSVHVGSGRTHIAGRVAGNLYAYGGDTITLDRTSRVVGDATVAGESVVLEGAVGRDLFVGGDRVELRGGVGRNVLAWAENLALLDEARVGGDVEAILPEGTEVEVAPGAVVGGETRSRPFDEFEEPGFARLLEPEFYLWLALHVGSGFLVGMLLYALVPGLYRTRLETGNAFLRSLGRGFVAALATPVVLALVALTLVGIPVAIIGAAVYLSGLYIGVIVLAALVGSALVHSHGGQWTSFGLSLLAGLVVVAFAMRFPYLGVPLSLIAIFTGFGLVIERARSAWHAQRAAPA